MPMKRRLCGLLLLVACSTAEPAAPTVGPAVPVTQAAQCSIGSKVCREACVSTNLPELGCAEPDCKPCSLAHASTTCSAEGRCTPAACENGFGDCNRAAADGCETDLAKTDASCGACGAACTGAQVCRKSSCVDRNVADAESWLAARGSGWCFDTYNQMINLCGDVEFCFDARFMRAYPTGIAIDIGFDFESATERANLVTMGGDCGGEGASIFVDKPGSVVGLGFMAGAIEVGLPPGKHLVSYQVNANGSALFVDGVRAGVGGAPQAALVLRDSCGPGLILGQRISYWWELAQKKSWGHNAPFHMQLRENVVDASAYSVTRATTAGPGTVLLFDSTGVTGSTWKASVGGITAVTKNTLSGDPELDAGASGPLPAWKPLTQCALK
jgi:hypothetical protein